MSIITPTFGDKNKPEISPQGDAGAPTRIVEQHEPLMINPWNGVNFGNVGTASLMVEQKANAPTIPTPAPAVEPAPLKIALIGTAPSSRMLAPYNDPSWKIWACSPGNMNTLPRADAWFEIHANLLWPECKHYGEPYIEWLKKLQIPVYMQNQLLVPNALTFPKDELIKEFGPFFFTSSFAWMMAFAMQQGAKEIALYGIDMASHDEYIVQRQGAYYFFTEAAKRGIKIWAPNESDIMQAPGLYGYSDVSQFGRKTLARRSELAQRIQAAKQDLAQHDAIRANKAADLRYLEGAYEDTTYYIEIHIGTQDNDGTGYLDKLLNQSKMQNSQG